MIYLDNNATTRVLPDVLAAMLPYFDDAYFNPSSAAGALLDAGRPLREARDRVARLIDCSPEEIVITSGATESNNWALQSVARRAVYETGRCHIVISTIEHPSVLEVATFLAEKIPGVEVRHAPVTADGVLDLVAYEELLRPDTALVSLMLANNESGTIQPVAEAAAIAKRISPKCIVHTDATQAVGKVGVSLQTDLHDVDLLSLSAHKFHGPKGIGAIFIRTDVSLDPLLYGGGQERGARAGTENPALAAGMAKAAELSRSFLSTSRIADLRDAIESSVLDSGAVVLGGGAKRLPNTSLILFPETDAEMLVGRLLEAGFVTSTGSACSSGSDTPSHVVLAMGVDYSAASGALRISLSFENTLDDVSLLLKEIRRIFCLSNISIHCSPIHN
jgi:cysteine desulfurase